VHAVQHAGQVKPGYSLTKADVDDFRAFLGQQKIEVDDAEWAKSLESIRTQLLYEIVNAQLGLQEGFKVLNDQDPQVQAALQLWDRATRRSLLEAAKLQAPEIGPKSDDGTEAARR
jgi:hypothetical protein